MGSDLNTKGYLILKSHILQHMGCQNRQIPNPNETVASCCWKLLWEQEQVTLVSPFHGCLALGWSKLLIRQWGASIHLQKGTSSVAGSSTNLMPKPSVMNRSSSVTTSCWPCQGSLGTCCEAVGVCNAGFWTRWGRTSLSESPAFFDRKPFPPWVQLWLITSHAGIAALHHWWLARGRLPAFFLSTHPPATTSALNLTKMTL